MRSTLSPKELAQAIGVSESSLRRWADEGKLAVQKTAGGHRRIPLAEAIRFVRSTNTGLAQPEILGLDELNTVGPRVNHEDPHWADEALLSALNEGRTLDARGLLLSLYLEGQSLASIFDGPIRHAMHTLGELWKNDDSGIVIEHAATDTCIGAIQQLRSMLQAPGSGARVALGGTPSSDPYLLPSLMVATLFSEAGFRTVNLGPDVPTRALLSAIELHQPAVVWCSISSPIDARSRDHMLRDLIDRLAVKQTPLVVGGRSLQIDALPAYPHLLAMQSMAELSAYLKGFKQHRRDDLASA